MSNVSNKKSRVLASRTLEVLARNKEGSPVIGFHEASLQESAPAVITQYDELRILARERRKTKEVRDERATILLVGLRKWVGLANLELPAFRAEEFRPSPSVVDDIINTATVFVAAIDEHELSSGVPLPFSEMLHAELVPALEGTKQASAKAADVEVTFTRARRELRLACERFNAHLVAFRTTLEGVLGRADPDYRRLRAAAFRSGEEDDELEEPDGEESTPVSGEAAAE